MRPQGLRPKGQEASQHEHRLCARPPCMLGGPVPSWPTIQLQRPQQPTRCRKPVEELNVWQVGGTAAQSNLAPLIPP